jgi:hypothetical protein
MSKAGRQAARRNCTGHLNQKTPDTRTPKPGVWAHTEPSWRPIMHAAERAPPAMREESTYACQDILKVGWGVGGGRRGEEKNRTGGVFGPRSISLSTLAPAARPIQLLLRRAPPVVSSASAAARMRAFARRAGVGGCACRSRARAVGGRANARARVVCWRVGVRVVLVGYAKPEWIRGTARTSQAGTRPPCPIQNQSRRCRAPMSTNMTGLSTTYPINCAASVKPRLGRHFEQQHTPVFVAQLVVLTFTV